MAETEIPKGTVFFFVLVHSDRIEGASAFMIPKPDEDAEQKLKDLIPDQWILDAPVGMYSFYFDPNQERSKAGFRRVNISAASTEAYAHAKKLSSDFASLLIRYGLLLKRVLDMIPSKKTLETRFDAVFMRAISIAHQRGQMERVVPGSVPFLLVTKSDREAIHNLALQSGVISVISYDVPGGDFAFHTHIRCLVQDMLDKLVPEREQLIVRERVRALRRSRRSMVGKRRKSVDAEIDHLCTAFGIEEDTITSLGWGIGQVKA